MERLELLAEIERRHQTRTLGILDAAGIRHSQVGPVGEKLFEAARKASEKTPTEQSEKIEHDIQKVLELDDLYALLENDAS